MTSDFKTFIFGVLENQTHTLRESLISLTQS